MKHLQTILKEAKHPDADAIRDEETELCFQSWLGLDNAATTAVTVEDCLPLTDAVFAAGVDWLVEAWTNSDGDGGYISIRTPRGIGTSTSTSTGTDSSSTASDTGMNDAVVSTSSATATATASSVPGTLSRLVSRASNPLLLAALKGESDISTTSTSTDLQLEAVYDSIRATKWLRAWMEFNISDADTDPLQSSSANSNDGTEVCRRLLRMDSYPVNHQTETAAPHPSYDTRTAEPKPTSDEDTPVDAITCYTKTSPRHALVRALYQHVQDLPVVQQQMLAYSQRLQQHHQPQHAVVAPASSTEPRNPHTMIQSSSGLLSDPSIRLKQYKDATDKANLLQQEWNAHLDRLVLIVGDVYAAADTDQRKLCRRLLGHVWSLYTLHQSTSSSSSGVVSGHSLRHENTQAAAIQLTLQVLRRILLGMSTSSSSSSSTTPDVAAHLLFHQLIPLHKANGFVLWRDQIAILELYHESLCQCMAILLHRNRTQLVPAVIQQLVQPSIFPMSGSAGKQVLLLHEIDTYLHLLLDPTDTSATIDTPKGHDRLQSERLMLQALLPILSRCMSSEHSRVAEQALQFFQNNRSFERLVSSPDFLEMSLGILLPALVRREPSWNPTVRKMTYNVLIKLQSYDESLFAVVSNRLFAHNDAVTLESSPVEDTSQIATAQLQESASTRAMTTTVRDFSLKSGMGDWKPSNLPSKRSVAMGSMPPPLARHPPSANPRLGGAPGKGMAPWANVPSLGVTNLKPSSVQPPSTVTGVAPWAMSVSATLPTKSNTLTATGVAPWAVNTTKLLPPTLGNNRVAPEPIFHATIEETSENSELRTGLDYVLSNMAKLKPPHEEDGLSSWSVAQMAETPTLLPHLKFHDLVFGHDLGSGAFGYVRYARVIDKAKPRSQWTEVAVKMVSTEKIRELGYEASIQREIAVLRLLSHPGIARLVSSFRFQSGAYLVLEYASRGDLHTLLQKHGSLDIESTRFVIGELVAALASIHESGFLYGDLKPENVVITETGHVKITDFGGCRPVTETARALVKSVARDILQNMRDGDWKENPPTGTNSYKRDSSNDVWNEKSESEVGEDAAGEDNERIEGTTSYLPPEVVMGAFPTIAADSWALGCVTYQCLSGRPPLLEVDEVATKNRIVSFDFDTNSNELDRLFDNKHASAIAATARDMITLLLDRNPSKRPGMNKLAEHEFFTSNVFVLYNQPAYPLDVGAVAPSPNAQWSRRQFSSIWAPQPTAYDITLPTDDGADNEMRAKFGDAPIREGDEASSYFSPSGKLTSTSTENSLFMR